MTKKERIDLAGNLLNSLTEEPKALSDIAAGLGKSKNSTWYICEKLKKAQLLKVQIGSQGGLVKGKGASYEQILKALGYWKEPTLDKVECVCCGEYKFKIKKTDTPPIPRRAVYLDCTGSVWSGDNCPDCVAEGAQQQLAVKLDEGLTTRRCRICKAPLRANRYFHCVTCVPALGTHDDEFIYHGSSSLVGDFSLDEEF